MVDFLITTGLFGIALLGYGLLGVLCEKIEKPKNDVMKLVTFTWKRD